MYRGLDRDRLLLTNARPQVWVGWLKVVCETAVDRSSWHRPTTYKKEKKSLQKRPVNRNIALKLHCGGPQVRISSVVSRERNP